MKRIIASAVFGLSLLAFPGCDEQRSGARTLSDYSPAAAPDKTGSVSVNEPTTTDASAPALARLQNEAAGPAPVAEESLAQKSAAYFDGSKNAGTLRLHPDESSVVAGSREDWRGSPKAKPNSLIRTVSLDGGKVPLPDTLPKVSLPNADPSKVSAGAKGGGPVLLAYEAFERAFYDKIYPVFSRRAWHAAAATSQHAQSPSRVTVHHTSGKQTFTEKDTLDIVRGYQAMHMDPTDGKHGWDDIGYHFLIDGAGRVVEARHPDLLGAHAKGYNENNIGIALMGDFQWQKPTESQVDSLRRLVTFLALKYRTDPRQKGFLEGHKHFHNPKTGDNNTDCPGKNVVAILEALRLEIDGDTLDLAKKLKPKPAGSSTAFTPLVVTQPADA